MLGHFQTGKNGKTRLGLLKFVTERLSANSALASFAVKFLQMKKRSLTISVLQRTLEIVDTIQGANKKMDPPP